MIGCLFGRAQMPPQTWEHFSNLDIRGAWNGGEWDEIVDEAERLGYAVRCDGEKVCMWKHENDYGDFVLEGGMSMALEFLGGVA